MEFDLTEVEKARIISSQNSGFYIVVTKPGSQRPEIIGGEWINEGAEVKPIIDFSAFGSPIRSRKHGSLRLMATVSPLSIASFPSPDVPMPLSSHPGE